MSFSTILAEIKSPFTSLYNWFQSRPVIKQIEGDLKSAEAELIALTEQQLTGVATSSGLAILGSLAAGSSTGVAIDAGIVAAEAAFATAGKTISKQTTTTLVTSVLNGLKTPAAAPATATPAPATAS
jgi:hypothetical protein